MRSSGYRSSHPFLVAMLLSLATLVSVGALGARWLDDQVLSTSGWTAASGQLLKDTTVRRALATYAVQRAFSDGGIDSALDHSLGDAAGGAAALRLRAAAEPIADRVLSSRSGRRAFRVANRDTQRQLVHAVEGAHDHGPVRIDLTPIVRDVVRQLAAGSIAGAIPGASAALGSAVAPDAGRLTVLTSSQAKPLRTGVSTVRLLAWLLPAAAIALFLLCLLLAGGRRVRTLSRIGYRLIIAAGVVLIARWAVQWPVSESLAAVGVAKPAVRAAWLAATSDLRSLGVDVLIAGAALVVVSWCGRIAMRVD